MCRYVAPLESHVSRTENCFLAAVQRSLKFLMDNVDSYIHDYKMQNIDQYLQQFKRINPISGYSPLKGLVHLNITLN